MKLSLRHIPLVLLLILLLAAGVWVARFAWDKSHNLDKWVEIVSIAMIENDPETISRLRPSFRGQLGSYNEKLTSHEDLLKKNALLAEGFLREMEKRDTTRFTDRQRLTYTLIRRSLQNSVKKSEFSDFFFPLNPVEGVQTRLPELFAQHHEISSRDDANAWVIRFRNVDESILIALRDAEARVKKGFLPQPSLIAATRKQIADFLQLPVMQNPFYTGYARKLVRLDPTELNEYDAAKLLEQTANILENEIYPAYRQLDIFLSELPSNPEQEAGLWHLPKGSDYYKFRLTLTGLDGHDPSGLHNLGLKSADSLALLLAHALKISPAEASFPGKKLREWSAIQPTVCSSQPLSYNPCLPAYQKTYRETLPLVSGLFDNTAEISRVSFIPAGERENTFTFPVKYFPAADSATPGRMWINPLMTEDHKVWRLRSVIHRYLIPGQHFRQSQTIAQKDLPEFQKYEEYPAYAEGWALYSDYLMDHDLSLYSGDSISRVGYLEAQLRAAALLAMDTGIHWEKWTPAEGKKYLEEKAGFSPEESAQMLQSILSRPGYFCGAWVGFSELVHLRKYAEKNLEKKFYLPEYHSALLFTGSCPVDVVTLEIRKLIQKKLAD
ncbi:MAG: DUF885 family protein [Bacteroidia bacterium]|nr:DUF885 family protein [Bacteroidia bacterium]